MTEIKEKEEIRQPSCGSCNRCPDYDDECIYVVDHLHCFMGTENMGADGTLYVTPMAKGFCPFVHTQS